MSPRHFNRQSRLIQPNHHFHPVRERKDREPLTGIPFKPGLERRQVLVSHVPRETRPWDAVNGQAVFILSDKHRRVSRGRQERSERNVLPRRVILRSGETIRPRVKQRNSAHLAGCSKPLQVFQTSEKFFDAMYAATHQAFPGRRRNTAPQIAGIQGSTQSRQIAESCVKLGHVWSVLVLQSLRCGGAAILEQHALRAAGRLQRQTARAIRPAGCDVAQQGQVLLI